MAETLLSVGVDVGTTTTQLVVSELTVQNQASSFAVPELEITRRYVVYESPMRFTPLLDTARVDGRAIREIVEQEYKNAGIDRTAVDTGAIIITGETSRKENARAVLDALSDFAGEFVVATAGPDLESVLAAKGAGAVEFSRQTGKTVLHMDIGGGTSNLALIEDGVVTRTGCLNVGGRLLKFDSNGAITYVSPVLGGVSDLQVGDTPTREQVAVLAETLTQALEMAAGLREKTELLDRLTTEETESAWEIPSHKVVISFSGGVADCIETERPANAFGDIGAVLGRAIRESRLCQGQYMLGQETIRATVIGAGCHSAQLSGSTVFYRDIQLPVKNLPVASFTPKEQESKAFPELIARRIRQKDAPVVVLAMPGIVSPSYAQVCALAETIAAGTGGKGVYVCLEADMAKALGHTLCLRLPPGTPCLCIDRVHLQEDSFLDVGAPVGPALPVVIKTLVLGGNAYGTG